MSRNRGKETSLLLLAAAVCAVGFVGTLLAAFHSTRGLELDRNALARLSGASPVPAQTAGRKALGTIDRASVLTEIAVLLVLGVARGRIRRALGAGALVVVSVGSAELLKHWLIPRLPHLLPTGREASFPSGHTAVACSVGLGLVIAVPEVLRPLVALAGAAYAAGIAFALVILSWHYPSDVVASFFLCGFWAALIGIAIGARGLRRPSGRGVALAALATGAALAVAVLVASRHPYAADAARSRITLLAAGAALGALSLGVFGALMPLLGERPR